MSSPRIETVVGEYENFIVFQESNDTELIETPCALTFEDAANMATKTINAEISFFMILEI